jgi:hypothetical protein
MVLIPDGCPVGATYTSRPKDRIFTRRSAGWYLFGFARSRHTAYQSA